jgi:hypothetical protein
MLLPMERKDIHLCFECFLLSFEDSFRDGHPKQTWQESGSKKCVAFFSSGSSAEEQRHEQLGDDGATATHRRVRAPAPPAAPQPQAAATESSTRRPFISCRHCGGALPNFHSK